MMDSTMNPAMSPSLMDLCGPGFPFYSMAAMAMANMMRIAERDTEACTNMPMMNPAMSPSLMNLCGPGSPVYNMAMATANIMRMAEVPLAANMRGAPLNPLSQQMNNMRFPGSPISSLTNGGHMQDQWRWTQNRQIKKENHIKRPLNAFMFFMKENRPKLLNDAAYKDKQDLNKELAKMWLNLKPEERQKYLEMAKKDKEDYKKLKRRRGKTKDTVKKKKCRARFGTSRQDLWCKSCKRKRECEWVTAGDMGMGPDMQDRMSASADDVNEIADRIATQTFGDTTEVE